MTAIALPSASGPIYTREDLALRAGRAYTISTGVGLGGAFAILMCITFNLYLEAI